MKFWIDGKVLVMGIEDVVIEEKLLVIMMIEREITVLIYIFYVA